MGGEGRGADRAGGESGADRAGGESGAAGYADGGTDGGALELTAYKFSLTLRRPLLTSRGPISKRNGILVSLTDSDGLAGWGQSMPLPHLTPDVLANEIDCVLRQQPHRTLSELMAAAADQTHCLSALSSAWCDLRARQSRLRLCDWLVREVGFAGEVGLVGETSLAGGARSTAGQQELTRLPLSALIDPGSVAESAGRARAEGYLAVKLKVGAADFTQDLKAVRQLRQALGDDVKLRLDANGAWDLKTASQHIRQLAEHDIDYIEEPVSGLAELSALGELARNSPIDIAADESIRDIGDLRRALTGGEISVLVIKPTVLGDLEQLLAVLAKAEQPRRMVITSALDSSLGIAYAAHFGAALAWQAGREAGREAADTSLADLEPCGLDTARLLADDLCQTGLDISQGQISLPDGHGLGVAPTKQALELYAEEIAKFALN